MYIASYDIRLPTRLSIIKYMFKFILETRTEYPHKSKSIISEKKYCVAHFIMIQLRKIQFDHKIIPKSWSSY
jgi:hypothetical protein